MPQHSHPADRDHLRSHILIVYCPIIATLAARMIAGVLLLSQAVETHYASQLVRRHAERFGYLLKDRVVDVLAVGAVAVRDGQRCEGG
jgi:hypothetical protein